MIPKNNKVTSLKDTPAQNYCLPTHFDTQQGKYSTEVSTSEKILKEGLAGGKANKAELIYTIATIALIA